MLYGNIIFIKKTGGDGSKYPVTQRDIKIGRSEECLIRIYNPQVAPEHCQLFIEENGQATLRNLSNQTILNGKPLGQKDVVLCHGDIFKLGERLARWEYLPTSKYFRQLLSPTGRLVAVVMPQQRPLGEQETPKASVSQATVSRNTPLGKRRYSERNIAESASAVKMRKSSGSELISKSRGDPMKFLTGRHSLKTTKLMLKSGKLKERKSISGIISSKISKGKVVGKSRKSTLPQWKVNIATPPEKISPDGRSSLKKSNRESVKSPKSAAKTPSKNFKETEKSLLASKIKTKTPQKALLDFESSIEVPSSTSKSVSKTPIKAVVESPPKSGSSRSTKTIRKSYSREKSSLKLPSKLVYSTPKPKSPKLARLVHSESKISSIPGRRLSVSKRNKKMSLVLERVDFRFGGNSVQTSPATLEREDSKIKTSGVDFPKTLSTRTSNNLTDEAYVNRKSTSRKSLKNTTAPKTPRKSKEGVRKSSAKRMSKSIEEVGKKLISPTTEKQQSRTPRARGSKKYSSVNSQDALNLESSSASAPVKNTPVKKTPAKSVKSAKKTQSPSPSRKTTPNQKKSLSSSLSSPDLNSVLSPRRKKKISTVEATKGKPIMTSPRGVQRKLSPSSSAERAAKKLKTSSPRKPDKNKKAALLVLGKANRTHLNSQNVKVLLKQKIVKKALKQSTAISAQKDVNGTKIATKLKQKKVKAKKNAKPQKSAKLTISHGKSSPSKTSKSPVASPVISESNKITQEDTPQSKVLQGNQLSASKVLQTPSRFSSKGKSSTFSEATSKQNKGSESSFETNNVTISPSISFEKNAENYLLNSLRRCSKRLSSKNDTGRPDFIELSPTALGLIPKNLEMFKTPKDFKRSSSLVTPKNVRTTGIIKSASTSKIGNRKSVRFSPKDVSYNTSFSSPSLSEKMEFDFSSFNTPNITMDVFVSPLSEKSSITKKNMNEPELLLVEKELAKSPAKNSRLTSNSEPKLSARKLLQSPQPKKSSDIVLSNQNTVLQSPKSLATKLTSPIKGSDDKSSKNCLSDFDGVQQLFETPKTLKSPKNNLPDVNGISKLLQTPKVAKSPKNEVTDLKGVREYLQTLKGQKSPKNDLTDVRGVKRLLKTPKAQKSPKNDLTDVRGVKKLLRTPKVQKSPKNDLTDIRGVKKLLRTPKVQKSPKNDLSDVRGVKKLLRSPKVQKSPKNDLTDVRGVRKLLETPKLQKSPKNDLTDVRGVKRLLQSPKVQKSPKNDLTDVRGVKRLLQSPKVQKSPKNDLTDVRGVKKLLRSPKVQKSPKNDLTDVRGVKKLLETPKVQKSPKNNLLDVSGLGNLFESPIDQKLSKNSSGKAILSPQSGKSLGKNLIDVTKVNELLISKSPANISQEKQIVSRKSRVKDFKAIRGRRTIKPMPKSPKNDISDVMGVRELFLRHQPANDYSVNLSGVAELFELPESDAVSKPKAAKNIKKSSLKVSEVRSLRRRKVLETEGEKDETITTRGGRSTKVADKETEKKMKRTLKSSTAVAEEKKPAKRKAVGKVKTSPIKKASVVLKKSRTARKPGEKSQAKVVVDDKTEIKSSRKRKNTFEAPEPSPPKLRRKLRVAEEISSTETKSTPKRSTLRSKSGSESEQKTSVKRVQKVTVSEKNKKGSVASSKVQIKKAIKTGSTKQTQKVQNKRSQSKSKNVSESKENASPRKTRSVKTKANTVILSEVKTAKSVGGSRAKKSSPVAKRSTRRKVK